MTSTTTPAARDRHSSLLCPKCGSEKVGFSDTNELKCQCGHLFEPPEHMSGKGTPKAHRNKKVDIVSRRKRDQFYWYLNDVLVEYSPGPRPFRQWQKDNPDKTIQEWAKGTELALYLDVDRITVGWLRYFRSPNPDQTRKELSDPKNVLSLFREDPPVALDESLLERFGLALVKPLLGQEHRPLDLSTLPDWLHLDLVITVIWQITMKEWSKEKIRKIPSLVHNPDRKGERSRDSVFKYCDYIPPDLRKKD